MKKDFNKTGSKERFVEMFQKVNKIKLNEESQNPDFFAATGLIKLLNKELKVNKTNIQSNDNESFVELNCFDENNKPINFRFKVTGIESNQEGVYSITDAILVEFSTDEMTLPEANLTRLNQNMKNQILDVVSEFVDFEEDMPEISEERYMDAIKKIDSYPFGGTPRDDIQTMKAYADEKPNNSNIRVKAPELDKYVDETINLDPIAQQQYNASSSPERKKEIILKAAQKAADFLNQLGMTVDHLTHEGYIILIKRMINDVHLQKTVGLNENEEEDAVSDDTGNRLSIGDVVTGSGLDGNFQIIASYSENKPFLVPFNIDTKQADLNYRIYLTALKDLNFNKVLSFSDTEGGFLRENEDKDEDDIVDTNTDIEEPETQEIDVEDNLDADTEIDVDQVISDKEKAGDLIAGGLGDDKSPSEFNKEQLMLGMEVEMEHTNNPMIALEIAIDHLTENPEYYTTKDDPDMAAQANAVADAEEKTDVKKEKPDLYPDGWKEMDGIFMNPDGWNMKQALAAEKEKEVEEDEEMTDVLLGYEPKNVGDEIEFDDEEEEIEEPEKDVEDSEEKEEDLDDEEEKEEMISEAQIKKAKQALNNRGVSNTMTKKEAVETLIRHYIK